MNKSYIRHDLPRLLDSVAQKTIYDAGQFGKFTLQQFQDVSRKDKLRGSIVTAGVRAVVQDTLMNEILPKFRELLTDFVDEETDRIGNGLVHIVGGISQPPLSDFVQILIRAGAILGGERTAELLIGWIKGEPIKYQAIILLNGVTIDKPLILKEGLQMFQLPRSSSELVAYLPPMSIDMYGLQALLGRAALAVECEASPALYAPSKEMSHLNNVKHTWAGGRIENFIADSFCESMSLACGGCVRWQFSWNDFGDVGEFCSVYGGTSYTNAPIGRNACLFTEDHFEQVLDIHDLRNRTGKPRRGLDTAARRWVKSKSSESLSDQFIELRIALEALYLDDKGGELGFRLASYGAWHISECMDERKQNFQTLLQTYKLASKAVHGSDIKRNSENKKLLEDAQRICQKGILKRLREDMVPKWDDLIMGNGI